MEIGNAVLIMQESAGVGTTTTTSFKGDNMKQGDTVLANGWPAIVLSSPKGARVMCAVFGWALDYGDVWVKDVKEITLESALSGLGWKWSTREFMELRDKQLKERARKERAKELAQKRKNISEI